MFQTARLTKNKMASYRCVRQARPKWQLSKLDCLITRYLLVKLATFLIMVNLEPSNKPTPYIYLSIH